MERKIPPKPVRPQQLSDEVAERFISGAPDQKPTAPPAPAPAAQPEPAVPRTLRKRKEPVTMTLDPAILAEFDELAAGMGLSRAAATGMAMRRMIDEEKAKRR
ncbi:hypothetical protein QPK32_24945 [Massilia sp. YIM B02763]|uniref:ribbon-helix-helix protein, CopG family n=1 Tax=Massilia sp. YIM B02763 TaxID=3050130 RepID=UPI0025B6F963|nr:ribbon-helix-helix protein, CopG family [Massilia sp. YIM B02763]MDN4056318.1 hypothetical protein [Massilia sp. YIM B02763]